MKNGTDHGRAVCSNVTAAKINQKSLLVDYLENYELHDWLLSRIQTQMQMPDQQVSKQYNNNSIIHIS